MAVGMPASLRRSSIGAERSGNSGPMVCGGELGDERHPRAPVARRQGDVVAGISGRRQSHALGPRQRHQLAAPESRLQPLLHRARPRCGWPPLRGRRAHPGRVRATQRLQVRLFRPPVDPACGYERRTLVPERDDVAQRGFPRGCRHRHSADRGQPPPASVGGVGGALAGPDFGPAGASHLSLDVRRTEREGVRSRSATALSLPDHQRDWSLDQRPHQPFSL